MLCAALTAVDLFGKVHINEYAYKAIGLFRIFNDDIVFRNIPV